MDTDTHVTLVAWRGPWADDDPDANFKAEVALYAGVDPMATVEQLAVTTGVPAGAIAQYALAKWAAAGAAAMLEIGPEMVERLWAVCETAESDNTEPARLAAYDQLRQMLSWLRAGE